MFSNEVFIVPMPRDSVEIRLSTGGWQEERTLVPLGSIPALTKPVLPRED